MQSVRAEKTFGMRPICAVSCLLTGIAAVDVALIPFSSWSRHARPRLSAGGRCVTT